MLDAFWCSYNTYSLDSPGVATESMKVMASKEVAIQPILSCVVVTQAGDGYIHAIITLFYYYFLFIYESYLHTGCFRYHWLNHCIHNISFEETFQASLGLNYNFRGR